MDEFGIFTPVINTPDVRVWPLYTHAEFDIDITLIIIIINYNITNMQFKNKILV